MKGKALDETTPLKIKTAAVEVFLANGYDGATMQAIADKAGVNKAQLHYYYRTKDSLFLLI
jgi:AcrR family transcriptional regulator